MKRHGNLWPAITDFANLLAAARNAQRGKRLRANVLRFNFNLEQELLTLQRELLTRTYVPGPYRTFEIKEPKARLISAAPYRDRVVHHALCAVIAPIFERTFIDDSYANRAGFGTHRALRSFTGFARSSRFVFQGDVCKYFPSIDHAILFDLIARKIKCRETLWLIETILAHSNPQEPVQHYFPGDDMFTPHQRRRGLPIGNLTSQFFANIYLNGFDHAIKEQVKARCYIRYVDDFAMFSDDREFLVDARLAAEAYLATVRLRIHPVKSQIFETRQGANFLGFRILPDRMRLRAENLRRARRRFRDLQAAYAARTFDFPVVRQALQSWDAHARHGDTFRLREQIFAALVLTRGAKAGQAPPAVARRVVEQFRS